MKRAVISLWEEIKKKIITVEHMNEKSGSANQLLIWQFRCSGSKKQFPHLHAGVLAHILFRETMLTRNTMLPYSHVADVFIY